MATYQSSFVRLFLPVLSLYLLATACTSGSPTAKQGTPAAPNPAVTSVPATSVPTTSAARTATPTVRAGAGETAVSPSRAQDIALDGGGAVLAVPQGAFNQATVIQAQRETASTVPTNTATVKLVADVYDLKAQAPADLTKPLTLRIPYKPELVPPGANPQALTLVWWTGDEWETVPGSKVDAQAHMISAQIDHFSKFSGAWSWLRDKIYDARGEISSAFYSAKYVAGDFTIHYANKTAAEALAEEQAKHPSPFAPPPSMVTGDDRPSLADANKNGVPDYVENLGRYLQDAKRVYDGGGPHFCFTPSPNAASQCMKVPVSSGGTIQVFVTNLGEGGPNGEADPVNSLITVGNKLSDSDLKNTAAHELYHYWQFSQVYLLTGNKHRWWLEATTSAVVDFVYPQGSYGRDKVHGGPPPEPVAGGLDSIKSRTVTDFYAAGSLAKYLENKCPGFIVRTFDPTVGLRLTESWQTTFARILRDQCGGINFADAFDDYLVSFFYLWDFDPNMPLWFGNSRFNSVANDHSFFAKPGTYQRVRDTLPPLSGRSIGLLSYAGLKGATLVFRQHGAERLAEISVFADANDNVNRRRVPLAGEGSRTGVRLAGGSPGKPAPDTRVITIQNFGDLKTGARANEAYLVETNNAMGSILDKAESVAEIEFYILQPPDQVKAGKVGADRVKVSWTASLLPKGEKPEDQGALHGYKVYRLMPGGAAPALVATVDANATSAEGSVTEYTGGRSDAQLVVRTVDKYGLESADSDVVRIEGDSTVKILKATQANHILYGDMTFTFELKTGGVVQGTGIRSVPSEDFERGSADNRCFYTFTITTAFTGIVSTWRPETSSFTADTTYTQTAAYDYRLVPRAQKFSPEAAARLKPCPDGHVQEPFPPPTNPKMQWNGSVAIKQILSDTGFGSLTPQP